VEGAQETEFTPRPWAWKILWSMLLSLNSRMETEPSEEAQARRQLGVVSCGFVRRDPWLWREIWRLLRQHRDSVLQKKKKIDIWERNERN
jgi:hypothetical protein